MNNSLLIACTTNSHQENTIFVSIYYILVSTSEMALIGLVKLGHSTDACLYHQLI